MACSFVERYAGEHGQANWIGREVVDDADLTAYFVGPVQERVLDGVEAEEFSAELQGLAGTRLGTETVEAVLDAQNYERVPWEVGEAMAQCLLSDHAGAFWPWNPERDKRTPRASLPGADLIGFVVGAGDARLAIGEVKTSSDEATPPSVMSGRSGMVHQLQRFEDNPELQGTVLKWLRTRCREGDSRRHYESAVRRFLNSGAKDVVLFGVLMRDTAPHVLDLENRGRTLGDSADPPTLFELSAWYVPQPIAEWPQLAEVGGSGG